MRLLLDTHALVWWETNDARLSSTARSAVADPSNEVFVSAASAWEIAVKCAKGQLSMPTSAAAMLAANGFTALAIDVTDAESSCALPPFHRDPWDRLLVAQALGRGLTLVSKDRALAPYGARLLW